MPRPRRPGAPDPKRRSRKGCWPCKARKVKCGEEKPACLNCRRQNEKCDYSIRLNWGGRARRPSAVDSPNSQSSGHSAHGQFMTLDLFSPTTDHKPPNATGGRAAPELAEHLLWDSGLVGNMALATSSPRGSHDIHESSPKGPPLNPSCTSDSASVDMSPPSQGPDAASPWPQLSPQMTATLSHGLPSYAPPIPHALDSVPYPSPADTSSSIGSLAALSFSPDPVTRPISFLRQTADPLHGVVHGSPSEHESPGHPTDLSVSANVGHVYTEYRPDAIGSHRRGSSIFSSHDRRDVSPVQTTTTTQESSLAKVMECPRASDRLPYSDGGHVPPAVDGPIDLTHSEKKWHAYLTSVTDNYGLDCGRPDLDLNKNNDHSAIDINSALDQGRRTDKPSSAYTSCSMGNDSHHGPGHARYDYYASPVPINIPRYLSPLPPSLVRTPINLMYFHHFLHHTARMLVPHDCADNPFVSVLPTMAIGDSNLLNLLLAYSASHRARYLGHPEPSNRIAHWVSNVFPTLRVALEDSHENVTDSHLAAAIMLLSLKIVSPSTFEVPIPWQSHLKLARDLFIARQTHLAYPGNEVGAFLTRWLGYLDIMGALSCRHSDPPLLDYYSVLSTCSTSVGEDEFGVDCFTGFTPRTGLFLTRLGRLVHQCDNERFDDFGTFLPDWQPSASVLLEAESLLADSAVLETHAHAHGEHLVATDSSDIFAIDRAVRSAGLVHLHRRVLNTPASAPPVRAALTELMRALSQIRPGVAADSGALFPLFTAGCESQDAEQRTAINERFEVIEQTGMKQIQNARALMQLCWNENLPWIALAQGEFVG
ncbi:hypothetical protein BDW42DRAFT_42300 [Aspergillus taichungensis]|uniref:Zn(2)-C6 fungal-type domain-containing protein n=1 Tax=Aspergillus taichungensis TaxID=482145 RepID=A0A2J5HEE3_9EURO|nr:hypothetical protein BDW42DRAFT_42300 [Aspergillus taichungensis]